MHAHTKNNLGKGLAWLLGVALTVSLAAAAGAFQPGDEEPPTPPAAATFVGKLDGGPASARIAVVTEGDSVLVYMCSQDGKFNQAFSRWLRGKLESNAFDLVSPDGVKVQGKVEGDSVQGKVAVDGQSLSFKAAKAACQSNVGLYRAVDVIDGEENVAGWIVDDDDAIAGAVKNKKGIQLGQVNKNGNLGLGKQIADKVNSAKKPGEGRNPLLGKIDPATRQEILQDLSARIQKKGGSPLQAAFVNLLRRSQTGAKGVDELDNKLLQIARSINPQAIKKYIDSWDRLPVALRSGLLGKNAALASGKEPLSAARVKGLLPVLKNKVVASTKGAKDIKQVLIKDLVCVDETDPEFIGSDEIFVIYLSARGGTLFDPKQTQLYKGLDTGKTAKFANADAQVFPPAGGAPTTGDIEISAMVFEDDSADNALIADLVKKAGTIAGEILKATGNEKFSGVVDSVSDFFDTLIGGLPSTQFLGSDSIVVRENGTLAGLNGQSKNSLTVQRIRNNGKRAYRYDLKTIQLF